METSHAVHAQLCNTTEEDPLYALYESAVSLGVGHGPMTKPIDTYINQVVSDNQKNKKARTRTRSTSLTRAMSNAAGVVGSLAPTIRNPFRSTSSSSRRTK